MAPKWLKWAELPARKDIYTDKGTTDWGNHDLYPIVEKERTYGIGAFLLFWVTCGGGLSTFAIGSSYIVVGLTAGETCGAVLLGSILSAMNALAMGRVGAIHHLGFTMTARVSFGFRGWYLPLLLGVMGSIVFFGLQAYYGGQAISLMLSSIFPQYLNMKNTLPASAGGTTQNVVGFFLYIIIYFPIVYFVKPHQLEPLMWPAFIGTMGVVFGIMGYAVNVNGGTGSMVAPQVPLSASEKAFRFIQCISTVVGTYGGAADRFADWTRFAKKKNSHVIGSITGMPIVITLCALLGVITASATKAHYGTTYWQPLTYLQFVQKTQYTPGSRAACFFAGLAIFGHQVFVNATQNNITAGMDITGAFPRYVSMKRGAIIILVLGVVCQPWRFFTQASVFLSVISSFGVVTGPMTAILIIDYYFVRKGKWKIPDLFTGPPDSIYWYWHGVNWRAIIPYVIATIPSMPGLVENILGRYNSLVKIYYLNYLVGFGISFVLFFGINYFFPPPGKGEDGKYIYESFDNLSPILEGIGTPVEGNVDVEVLSKEALADKRALPDMLNP